MPAPSPVNYSNTSLDIEESEIDELLLEFNGDAREAIRALLNDIAILAEDRDNSVSYGYVRGRLFRTTSSLSETKKSKLEDG